MTKKQEIKLFEDKKVRTVWDDEKEKWFFCVVDVVEALTDSKDPKDYIKKMKKRDPELMITGSVLLIIFQDKQSTKGNTNEASNELS